MIKRSKETALLLLAFVGIILYVAVILISSYLSGPLPSEEAAGGVPAITQQQAADTAVHFVRQRFTLPGDYKTSTLYQTHSGLSGYLQKERLFDSYTERYAHLPLDYYEVEINDLANSITYYIDVNYATQQVIGWKTYMSPSTKADRVTGAEPELLAERTITEQGYSLDNLTKLAVAPDLSNKSIAPSLTGRLLTYESKTDLIGEAALQLSVTISKGQVVSFQPEFSIPSSFLTWQEQQNDSASLMTRISMGTSLIMAAAALVIIIRYWQGITFRRGLWLSFCFLAIYIGNNFNMLPAFRTFHTTGPSQSDALLYLWFLNTVIAIMAVSVYVSVLAGRQMWSRYSWNPLPDWQDSAFGSLVWQATTRGYLLCFFILGVQQALFFVAEQVFDVWAVNDAASSVLNMTIPGLFPLMAWAAAISEESVYRLFGIAFFLSIVRNRFLAVLLPSIIWALSHTEYPIYPVYTRLVEVTIIGMIFGYAFLKYGFMTVLFAHASMDSMLMGLSLYGLGDWQHLVVGSLYLIVPGLVGWVLYRLHGSKKRRTLSMPRLDPD